MDEIVINKRLHLLLRRMGSACPIPAGNGRMAAFPSAQRNIVPECTCFKELYILTREDGIKTVIPLQAEYQPIRTPQALAFVTKLQRTFDPVRLELLEARRIRQQELAHSFLPAFLLETACMKNQRSNRTSYFAHRDGN